MESQPQNPEFRTHPENFHPCRQDELTIVSLQEQGLIDKCVFTTENMN